MGEDPFDLRLAWTWDHLTNWVPRAWGTQNTGASNPYTKRLGTFLADYVRLIDFLAANGFNAVCIIGIFRDAHGEREFQFCIDYYRTCIF